MNQNLTYIKGPNINIGIVEKTQDYRAIAISTSTILPLDNYQNETGATYEENVENIEAIGGLAAPVENQPMEYGPQEPVYQTEASNPVVQPQAVSQVIPAEIPAQEPQRLPEMPSQVVQPAAPEASFGTPVIEQPVAMPVQNPVPETRTFAQEEDNALLSITQPEEDVTKVLDMPETEDMSVSNPEAIQGEGVAIPTEAVVSDVAATMPVEDSIPLTPEQFAAQQQVEPQVESQVEQQIEPQVEQAAEKEPNLFDNPNADAQITDETNAPEMTQELPQEATVVSSQENDISRPIDVTATSDNKIVLGAVLVEQLRNNFEKIFNVMQEYKAASDEIMNNLQTSLALGKDEYESKISSLQAELSSVSARTAEVAQSMVNTPDNVLQFPSQDLPVQQNPAVHQPTEGSVDQPQMQQNDQMSLGA